MSRFALAAALLIACGHAAAPPQSSSQPPPSRVLASRSDPQPLLDPAADADGDEIANGVDACPDKPEDFDLRDDTDGCPDLDDDRDGVPDLDDHCFDTPGRPEFKGCPIEDCVFVTDITDCWLSPIAFDTSPPSSFDHIANVIKQYPEIREVTLQTQQSAKQPAGTARARLERVKKELVARGIPATFLALKELDPDADPHNPLRSDVFGLVTKQRFAEGGKFRETVCADELGPVYRVARTKNYGCNPSVCGDHRCGSNESATTCPQDCGP